MQSSLGSCNLLVVTQNSENKYEVYTDLHKREETAAVSASQQMLKLWKYRQWASSEKNQMGNPRTVVCRSMEIQKEKLFGPIFSGTELNGYCDFNVSGPGKDGSCL